MIPYPVRSFRVPDEGSCSGSYKGASSQELRLSRFDWVRRPTWVRRPRSSEVTIVFLSGRKAMKFGTSWTRSNVCRSFEGTVLDSQDH